jgi:hypothetical protein
MVSAASTSAAPVVEDAARAAWGRVGAVAGYVAGVGILAQTTLFLLDATDVLADSPEFVETDAGRVQDLAAYYAAYFDRQHEIGWNIMLRDAVGPIAFVALVVAALATANLVRSRRPESQLLVLFLGAGALLAVVQDLIYLSLTAYWREDGWPVDVNMVAAGRAVEAVNNITVPLQQASFVVLAAGLICLARVVRAEAGWSRLLGLMAYAEAAGLAGAAVASALRNDPAFKAFALLLGVLLGPAVAVLLGRQLGRAGRVPG